MSVAFESHEIPVTPPEATFRVISTPRTGGSVIDFHVAETLNNIETTHWGDGYASKHIRIYGCARHKRGNSESP
jgi:hypothetical protein